MTVGDVLDRSIQLYRTNLLKFIGIVLLIKGPYLIFVYIFSRFAVSSFTEEITHSVAAGEVQMVDYLVAAIFSLIVALLDLLFISPVLIAAMTMAISERFLNRDIGIMEAYGRILKRFFPLLGTILLSSIVISSGFILGLLLLTFTPPLAAIVFLAAPFIACVLWVWYAFISQTVVIEGEGGLGAMKRSKSLVEGYFWKTFALLILIVIAFLLIESLVSYGIGRSLFFLGQKGSLLGEGTSNVIKVLLEPFRIAAVTLLYYDLRIRKEGFDLEMMAKEMDSEAKDDYNR